MNSGLKFSHKLKDLNYSNSISCLSLPRYRWYSYKEGFSANLVNEAISETKITIHDLILDPFNGCGTTTLTSSKKGFKSIGIEVNPFAAFVSRVKETDYDRIQFALDAKKVITEMDPSIESDLLEFSTFSEKSKKNKWLFNSSVLNSFESGWQASEFLPNESKNLIRLSLIGAAMDNSNAVKDGKCLKYKKNWQVKKYCEDSFMDSFSKRLNVIFSDLEKEPFNSKSKIITGDTRKVLKNLNERFKLCITSPPYLNSFDYTDIYRPELFLGKFINNNIELRQLRFKTIRSHMEIKLPKLVQSDYGEMLSKVINEIFIAPYLWDKQIPTMIISYFEDIQKTLKMLWDKAENEAQLWMVVSNSVYAGIEIPVDLILAELGSKNNWKIVKIEVLRNIKRRKTKYNGNIKYIRESLIVFKKLDI